MRRASSLSRWRVRVDECRLQKGGRGQRASVGFAIPVGVRRLVCVVVSIRPPVRLSALYRSKILFRFLLGLACRKCPGCNYRLVGRLVERLVR